MVKKDMIALRIHRKLKVELWKLAEKEKRTMSNYLTILIEEAVKKGKENG